MKTPYIDRKTTAALKGLALIFMFVHHFFAFPEWYLPGIAYPGFAPLIRFLREPLKICVVLFAFLTGYFYAFSSRKTVKYSLRKITDLLLSYWLVYIPLLAVFLVTGCGGFSLSGFVKELLSLDRPIMCFCWYVYFYAISMMLLPVLDRISTRSAAADAGLLLVAPMAVFTVLRGLLEHELGITEHVVLEILNNVRIWFPCIIIGYLCGKYAFFETYLDPLTEKIPNRWCRYLLYLALCGGSCIGRVLCPRFSLGAVSVAGNWMDLTFLMDVFYGPLFFYGAVKLLKAIPFAAVHKPLEALGKQSMLMWFLHCAFFGATASLFQPVLYLPKNPLLVILWGLALCYVLALVLDIPLKGLLKLKNKLFQ